MCFGWKGKGLIQPQSRYLDSPMETFMEDNSLPIFTSLNPDDSSSSDDGEPAGRPTSERPFRQRLLYPFSQTPGLDMDNSSITTRSSSDLSYIAHPPQMYSLEEEDGALYTNRHIAPATVNLSIPGNGVYPCLFAFDACKVYCTTEDWVSHVGSHLGTIEPPKSCKCTICHYLFETDSPAITWNRFLCHVINHKERRNFNPDKEFLEYCTNNDIISELTKNRLDQYPGNPQRWVSQEPVIYKHMTPRVVVDRSGSVATVDYPQNWSLDPTRRPGPDRVVVMAKRERMRLK